MSVKQKRTELSIFGYVNQMYNNSVPVQLIKLIYAFYEEHMYLIFKDKKLEAFQYTQKLVYSKSLNIKGITFKIQLHPNGVIYKNIGIVTIKFEIVNWPKNIEYIKFYREIACEQTEFASKKLNKLNTLTESITGYEMCYRSELKDFKVISFSILIDIKHIKYKKYCNKIDYFAFNNTMLKYYKFTWNINNSLMNKCKTKKFKQFVVSENFDNNNWCLKFAPNGSKKEGRSAICLNCLSMPYNISAMKVMYSFCVNGNKITNLKSNFRYGSTRHGVKDIMSFDEFKEKESISFTLELKIIYIYDLNNVEINKREWRNHGIVMYRFPIINEMT